MIRAPILYFVLLAVKPVGAKQSCAAQHGIRRKQNQQKHRRPLTTRLFMSFARMEFPN
jgi:hypothetical protein